METAPEEVASTPRTLLLTTKLHIPRPSARNTGGMALA